MDNCRVFKFEDLVRKWRENNCPIPLARLLGLSRTEADSGDEEVYERFRGTFWEVSWPNPVLAGRFDSTATYRYLSDSLLDALRLRPYADFPYMEKLYVIMNQCCAEVSDDIDFEDEVYGVFEGLDEQLIDDDELACFPEPELN